MLKDLLRQYAAYNLWANKQLMNVISQLPEHKVKEEITSSFPGIFNTMLHMLDTETVWWQRMKLQEHTEAPSQHFAGNAEDLQKKLLLQSALIDEWVAGLNDYQLQHVFGFYRSRVMYKQTVHETLLHIFNHASYHRGQIITMLRQLGVTKIPGTDFSEFTRLKHK